MGFFASSTKGGLLTYTNLAAFPAVGVSANTYIADDTEKAYRWTGSAYVEISAGGGGGGNADTVTNLSLSGMTRFLGGFTTDFTFTGNTALTFPLSGTLATQAYADALIVSLINDRGNFDASGNVFPSSGGSGTAGAIMKGNLWLISVTGTLGGHVVTSGDAIRALTDTPDQTDSNWAISENNFGYVAENSANKSSDVNADQASTVKYPTVKALYDWVVSLFAPKANPTFTGTATFNYGNFPLVTNASPNNSDLWQDATNRSLQFKGAGLTRELVGVIFKQTSTVTVSNTTTLTSLIGTGIGTNTVSNSAWAIGKTIRIRASGDIFTTGTPQILFQVLVGGTSIVSTGNVTTVGAGQASGWDLQVDLTCRTTGLFGTIIASGYVGYNSSTTNGSRVQWTMAISTPATINNTIDTAIDLKFDFGTASASNHLGCSNLTIEIL